MLGRRLFLKQGGLVLAGLGIPGNLHLESFRGADKSDLRPGVFVMIFLRGGLDGLNTVVPFGDPSYYSRRPHIAVPAPSQRYPSAIDLDGFFGLHPALEDLLPIYRRGHLAIVHAVGSAEILPSHFQAQRWIESALPASDKPGPVEGRCSGDLLPEQSGIVYPPGEFGQQLRHLARLIKTGACRGMVTLGIRGWDHHAGEGGVEGRLANRLKHFGEGLSSFHRDLEESRPDVLVLAISEFGRAVPENTNGGTDHGHGGVAFLMGSAIRGDRVYGEWPGLEQRVLPATTDFRQLLSERLQEHLGGSALHG